MPCGHNGCLQCMASVQQAKPECPLCRAPFDGARQLVVNHELRDLVMLARALTTVEQDGGWQAVTATKAAMQQGLLECGDGGAITLVPSAPPLRVCLENVLAGHADLLSLEPPLWAPDSSADVCASCQQPFWFLRRARHHCRLCGGLFCHGCTAWRALLPPKFQERSPQRVCSPCCDLLQPLQPHLAGTISKSVQAPVHDVTDYSVLRSWLNNPLSSSLEEDLFKATNTVRQFALLGSLRHEERIPPAVLHGAAGFAILSVFKVGLGWSAALGTGLVVARCPDRGWTPPSALAIGSVGWGLQVGGELTDLLIVLRSREAVQAFCGTVHVGVGGNVALAMGPLGRQADAVQHLSTAGRALCYSYSLSRGMFAGISIEGSCMVTRESVNLDFYGRPFSGQQLLSSCSGISPPAAAAALYDALDGLLHKVGQAPSLPQGSLSVHFDEGDRQQAQPLTLALPRVSGSAAPSPVEEQFSGRLSHDSSSTSTSSPLGRRGRSPSRRGRGSPQASAPPLDALGAGLYLGHSWSSSSAAAGGAAAAAGLQAYPPVAGMYPHLPVADEEPAPWMGDLFE